MNKDIKLICFDLDGTLIIQNSWYELNLALGITPEEDQKLFDRYTRDEISYEEWTEELLNLFKKAGLATKSNIVKTLAQHSLREGSKEIISYLKERGYKIALISGSIDILVDLIARDLDIELAEATNYFIFDSKNNLLNIETLGNDKLAKLNRLEEFCRKLGITVTEVACIGDGDNDIDMFNATKHGITFIGSKIEDKAWKTIENFEDLRKIF